MKLDASGNLYITDYYGNRLRFVDRATGIISTLAGDGQDEEERDEHEAGDGRDAPHEDAQVPTDLARGARVLSEPDADGEGPRAQGHAWAERRSRGSSQP